MVSRFSRSLIIFLFIGLTGCAQLPAPVTRAQPQLQVSSGRYRVNRGDTVYSIAWAFGLDYRALAAANHLQHYQLQVGQTLNLHAARHYQQKNISPTLVYYHHARHTFTHTQPLHPWVRPARGKIVKVFSIAMTGNKGIDIAGKLGESVRASNSGEVVYAGSGVRGYGNLIIIKHNANYLSAYAYNQTLLVHLGERVKAGQRIALLGRNNAGQPRLHFEIRRNGLSVNPLHYLQS